MPSNWTILNLNGDTDAWYQYTYSYYSHSGAGHARLYTDYNSSNDDWLITPQLSVAAGDSISFWTRAYSTSEVDEIKVLLSTTTTDTSAFTTTLMASTSIGFTTYARYALDLSAHAGSSVYVAFVRNEAPADGWLSLIHISEPTRQAER